MSVVFRSILKDEMASYMEFVKLSVVDYKAYQRTLLDFDYFLCEEGLAEKVLEAELVSRWLDGFTTVKPSTKKGKLTHIRKFSGYLLSLGIRATIPELPHIPSDFTPYVFSMDEMIQIFETADDLVLHNPNSRIAAEFPMLYRPIECRAYPDIEVVQRSAVLRNERPQPSF